MSTVLWANVLAGNKVESESADRYVLYKHADKLDSLTRQLGLPSFRDICDTTDLRFNVDELELPEGMESTDELMAIHGSWMPINEAVSMLEQLLTHITENQVRFGVLSNAHAAVVEELSAVHAFARDRLSRAQKFNFSVVM